jgi:photosystem II stability/assembly factor-like uncharacterized protein
VQKNPLFSILFLLLLAIINLLPAQWKQTNGPFGRQIDFFVVSERRIFAITNDSLFLSLDNGSSWSGINNGLNPNGFPFRSFAACGSNLFINAYGGDYFYSADNGKNWNEYYGMISEAPIWDFAAYDTNLFASTYGAGVFLSTNGGTTWSAVNNGLDDLFISWMVIRDSCLFIKNSDGIYRSSDYGNSWIEVSNGLPPHLLNNLWCLTASEYCVFVGGSGIFLSKDCGVNWIADTVGLPINGATITSIAISDTNIFASNHPYGIYRSTIHNENWTKVNNGLPLYSDGTLKYEVTCVASNGKYIFAGLNFCGVFVSTNNGGDWKEVSEGLTYQNIYSLAINGSNVFVGLSGEVGQGYGVWLRPLSEIINGIAFTGNPLPSLFNLNQNYPNPFNPRTVISYSLPVTNHIDLSIYNILGQKVVTLVNKKQPAGTYDVQFNANDLASGVYVYKLKAGSFEQSRKMILLR